MVDHVDRVVRNWERAPADVIIVGAEGDEFSAQLWIAAGDHRDDVAGGVLDWSLLVSRRCGDRYARSARLDAVDARAEKRGGSAFSDVEKRGQHGVSFVSLESLIWLAEKPLHLGWEDVHSSDGNSRRARKPATHQSALDRSGNSLRIAARVDVQHDDFSGGSGRIEQRCRVAPRSAVNRLSAVEIAGTGSLIPQYVVGAGAGVSRARKKPGRDQKARSTTFTNWK